MRSYLKYKTIIISLYFFTLIETVKSTTSDSEYIFESHLTSNIINFKIPDIMDYGTFNLSGSWTDNYGNFGSIKCVGENKLIKKQVEIYGVCEIRDEKKIKRWWSVERNKSELDMGVGVIKQLKGENVWKIMDNKICKYAVKHTNDFSYMKAKCKISPKQKRALLNHFDNN